MHTSAISPWCRATHSVAAGAWLFLSMLPGDAAAQGELRPAAVSVAALRCEYQVDPIGIDEVRPRLSWQLRGEGRDLVQSAYQIEVTHRGRVSSGSS